MGQWLEQIERRAELVHQQMAAARALAERHDEDPVLLTAPYRRLLRELYEEELPLGRALDDSDLVMHLRGPAVSEHFPRLSVVSKAFIDLRAQIGNVAKAISGLADRRLPENMELALSGFARGSIVLGVSLAKYAPPQHSTSDWVAEESDQLYAAVRDAIRKIAIVSKYITEEGIDDGIKEAIPDPGVRDALVVAAHKLSPSRQSNVESVSLYSPETGTNTRMLTTDTRATLRKVLAHPVTSNDREDFIGVIREIDLDARRFEIRGVKDHKVTAIRCVYPEDMANQARHWLDQWVMASGPVERTKDGIPRLMSAEQVVLRSASSDDGNGDLFTT